MVLSKTNHFFAGMGAGLIMPVVAYLLSSYTHWITYIGNKPLGFYVLAALINLLLVRYFYRNDGENTARGVIMITFLGLLVLIITKQIHI